jgi:lysophospholipase L1-like esterase
MYTVVLLLALLAPWMQPSVLRAAGPEPVRVACVGDSITYGFAIDDREHKSYPAQLAVLLGAGYEVKNFGVSAATLLKHGDYTYWERDAYKESLAYQPQIVVIMLGTNDSKPQNWAHKDEFAADYKALIASYAALDSHPKIYLCLPAPDFPGNWGITEDVIHNEVAPKIATLAEELHLPLIDMHAALAGRGELFADHVHPDATGAGIMAHTVADALLKDAH